MDFKVLNKANYSIISSAVDKLNLSNASELKSLILAVNKSNVNNLIIDLAETSYCDSSGLSALLSANRLCKNSNGQFVLTGLQPNVKKMIEIAQLHRVLSITETLEEAEKEIQ
ncbi:anti-sigma factor antagonist [Brumimicrobium glaciale]|jgi:anti-anti-sigma factor|uniref:Anti-sigma factor antagonist n=1 Tax=Brumimicrobium glaciale TaxID=200475 RepID=A0A4Q4KJA3_9FLAO|nr:STAS domain-containing protein [Brumimicrobium glaciale]RYM32757.1 anti-sigma factor antagonist [Brumimicrobium glaciale]